MKLNEKIYAQLANRVYDRKDIRNKMTLPEGVTELEWYDDDPESGFSAGVYQNGNQADILLFRLPYGCVPAAENNRKAA